MLTRSAPGRVEAAATGERDADPIEDALFTLLARHPDAVVFAIGADPAPQVVPMPASVRLPPHLRRVDDPDVALGMVSVEDRAVVARLWGKARNQGAAATTVTPTTAPGRASTLYMLDLRHRHDAMIGVLAEGDDGPAHPIVEAVRRADPPPRCGYATKDGAAVLVGVDSALCGMLGWSADELIGRRVIELVHPDDKESGIAHWMEMLDAPGPGRPVRLRHLHSDGSWVWLEVTNTNRLDDPDHGDVLAELRDVSEAMGALEALEAREQLLGQLTETVPVGLLHADLRGTVLFANGRLQELTGATVGTRLTDAICLAEQDRCALERAVSAAAGGADVDVEVRTVGPFATSRHCRMSIRPLRGVSGAVTGLTGCVEDVTAEVHAREELEDRAARDPLTGCLNRTATLAVLQDLLDGVPDANPPAGGTAVIFVDLDGFKPVNDRLGHAAGDELLMRIAERLRASVRASDAVGRFGGDEFVVVCPAVPSAEHGLRVARSLAARAFGPMDLGESSVEVKASLGVSWTDAPGAEAAELVHRADTAMYRSKRSGGSEPVLLSAGADEASRHSFGEVT